MSPYMEHNLIPVDKKNQDIPCGESYDYELIGVTVHTGTADGGHYYAFIKERTSDKVRHHICFLATKSWALH
jgi:ubiquitin carboxyl-terminal hydrolase 34